MAHTLLETSHSAVPFIDLEPIIAEATGGRADYNLDDATAFLMNWHGGGSNRCGVYVEAETVTLAQVGRCSAVGYLAKTAKGLWLIGQNCTTPVSGRSGGASVWNRQGYHTRDDAFRAAASACARFFASEANSRNSCMSEGVRRDCAKLTGMLTSIACPSQSTLFDDRKSPTDQTDSAPTGSPTASTAVPSAIRSTPVQLSLF